MNATTSPYLWQLCQLIIGQTTSQSIAPDAWSGIIHAAQEHEFQPLVAWLLKQQHFTLPEPYHTQVTTAAKKAAASHLLHLHVQRQITNTFDKAAIPHIWLKGIALAETVYPNATVRPMLDLDVLVAYEQRMPALTVLGSIGFSLEQPGQSLLDPNEQAQKNHLHHFILRGGAGNSIILELHFYLLGGHEMLLPIDHLLWFWQQTMTVTTTNSTFVCLAPEAHLLYLCAHAVLHHGLYEFILKRYLDLHFLIQQSSLDWSVVVEKAAELRWTYAVERALTLTQEWFETPIAEDIFVSLRQKRYPDENVKLVNALAADGAQLEQVLATLQVMSWRERLRHIHAILLPSQAYMRLHYQIPLSQRIWPVYLRRWWHQLQQARWALQQRLTHKSDTNKAEG